MQTVFHKIYVYFHLLYKRIIVNETEDMINVQIKGIGIQIISRTFGFATFDTPANRYLVNFLTDCFYIFKIGSYFCISLKVILSFNHKNYYFFIHVLIVYTYSFLNLPAIIFFNFLLKDFFFCCINI